MRTACLLQPASLHLGHALNEAALATAGEALGAEVALGALGDYLSLFDQPVG